MLKCWCVLDFSVGCPYSSSSNKEITVFIVCLCLVPVLGAHTCVVALNLSSFNTFVSVVQ